jgi:hypothetical protein
MSKGRLTDVKAHLDAANLRIKLPDGVGDLFDVQNEVIRWLVTNDSNQKTLELQFHLFDDLGRPTSKLTDILYAVTSDRKFKLYFEKRESNEWRYGLSTFVEKIRLALAT